MIAPIQLNGSSGSDVKGCGCVYVAFGFEYLMMAAHSALTLKRHNPSLPVTLITNVPIRPLLRPSTPVFDRVIYRQESSDRNRYEKLSIDLTCPYERTLYLDCDTEVWGDVSPAFLMLDDYDLAVRQLTKVTKALFDLANGRTARSLHLSEWSSGVIFFRKSEGTAEMFRRWRERFGQEGMTRDQPSFMRAILETPGLRLFPLSPLWSALPWRFYERDLVEEAPEQIRIIHYREPARRPEVARAIYRTFRALDVSIDEALPISDSVRTSVAAEQTRFHVLYRHYSVFLAPFDNRLGRRLFRWRNGLLFRFPYRLFLILRWRVIRDVVIRPGRDKKASGRNFPRVS